jgi:nucleoside-diphosphate-sugar epimerase
VSNFFNNKTILITGAHGFVGKNLVDFLADTGARLLTPSKQELNLIDQKSTWEYFKNRNIDVVIHLAGLVGGIWANKNALGDFFYQNAMMGINALHYSYKFGVKKFVGLAAGCGYPDTKIPYSEENFWDGLPDMNSYGYSMAKKNLIIQSWAYRDQYGFDSTILLPANLYGPHDNFDLESSHVVPALIRKFIESEDSVSVWGSGKASREFIYVEDVCRAISDCCEKENLRGPYNLGTGKETTVRELVDNISRITRFDGKIEWDTLKPDGQVRRYYDMSKFEKDIGYVPSTSLKEGLKKTIEWYRVNYAK